MPTFCFPVAQGVPGQPGGPNWYDNGAAPPRPFNDSTEDPRWRGAFSHSFGDGSGRHIDFRGLNVMEGDSRHVLLSWRILVGPSDPGGDGLFLGLGASAAGPSMIVRILIATSASTTAGTAAAGAYTAEAMVRPAGAGGSWGALGAAPSWVTTRARAWINYPSVATPLLDWGVQLAIPLGVELSPDPAQSIVLSDGSNFRMWYAAYLQTPVAGPGGAPVVEYSWPGTPGIAVDYPAPTAFVDVRAAVSTADAACTAEGVSIAVMDVGTRNADGTARPSASRIQVDMVGNPPSVAAPHNNMFFARPTFPAAASNARKEAIRARFRLANWGTHVGDLTLDSWSDVPGGEDVQFNLAQNECRFIWPLAASDPLLARFRSGAIMAHQCMLVELSSVFPSGETFTSSSVYRNMDFVDASRFTREAEVSVRGLAPLNPQPREVYLYVETRNMPLVVPRDDDKDRPQLSFAMDADQPEHPDAPQLVKTVAALRGLAKDGRLTRLDPDYLRLYLPTFRVHAYHDTGRTTPLLGGGSRKILRPQSSFGYFVNHEGELYGWRHSLEGAQQISANFYRLGVPNNGTARITTTIVADESGGCGRWLNMAIDALRRLLKL
jgi:hypothetical protein